MFAIKIFRVSETEIAAAVVASSNHSPSRRDRILLWEFPVMAYRRRMARR
jgi:hypothetical protein